RLDLVLAALGDGVALAVRPGAGLGLPDRLAVPREAAKGCVHLAKGQLAPAAEVGVVVALQLVAVARLAFEEAEEGHGNTHTCEHTLSVYVQSIASLPGPPPRLWRPGRRSLDRC